MARETSRPLRVLAIEDDPALGRLYREMLGDEGHQVRVAVNGAQALAWLPWQPDVILLDLMLPVMDGYEFLHRLRALPEGQGIPVLVLSAALPPGRDAICGAQAVVRKPFDFGVLTRTIDMYAGRHARALH